LHVPYTPEAMTMTVICFAHWHKAAGFKHCTKQRITATATFRESIILLLLLLIITVAVISKTMYC